MAGRVFVTPRGTMPPGYGKCYRTDAEYIDAHLNDPTVNAPITKAPAQMGVRSNIERCCQTVATFGLKSRINGAPRRNGEPEPWGVLRKKDDTK